MEARVHADDRIDDDITALGLQELGEETSARRAPAKYAPSLSVERALVTRKSSSRSEDLSQLTGLRTLQRQASRLNVDHRIGAATAELKQHLSVHSIDNLLGISKSLSRWEHLTYLFENAILVHKNLPFYSVAIVVVVFALISAGFWEWLEGEGEGFWMAFYVAFQVMTTAGYSSASLGNAGWNHSLRALYAIEIVIGIFLVSIFLGFMTESIVAKMSDLDAGNGRVAEKGHTLILGWNEATPRVVAQIAFLRRTLQDQNAVWHRRLFPWRRVQPSTPLAAAPILLMNTKMSAREMMRILSDTLEMRGIEPSQTRVGSDVICRAGDPTNVHDLRRMSAHYATSILVMMTARDEEEYAASNGEVMNGATYRTVLAARHILVGAQHKLQPGLNMVIRALRACAPCALLRD